MFPRSLKIDTRTLSRCALVAALCSSAFAASAAPPQPERNPYAPAYMHGYRHGAIPTRQGKIAIQQWATKSGFAKATSTNTLYYRGGTGGVGVLSGQSKVYLIFYGNQWGTSTTDANGYLNFSNDAAGAGPAAQKMFKGIGTNGELWSAELTQWCDGPGVATGASSCPSSGSIARIPYQQNVLAGVWYDNSAASPSAATGDQLAAEANKAAAHFGNTTAASNRYTYYVILSPTGTNPDNYKSPTQGYCAWHDYVGDSYFSTPTTYGPLAFSNQPYNIDVGSSCGVNFVNSGTAGKLDGYTMTLGHEWHEMMSDQFPAGGWTANSGYENSDECAWIAAGSAGGAANVAFSTGTFTQQASWSNDTNNCAISHAIVGGGTGGNTAPVANFSVTSSGLTANFTDTSTDAENNISTHSWNFGDGATSTATNPSHTYAAAGTYTVSETVTDSGGLSNTKSMSVTVGTSSCGGLVLCNGVAVALPSVAKNSWSSTYTITVPAGKTSAVFNISGGSGDADLYVRIGSAPTTSSYNCRPYLSGNAETCTFNSPTAGTYYVRVRAYAAYSGVSLKATISP